MKKLHFFVGAILLSSSGVSLGDDGFVRKLTPNNASGHPIGSEIRTEAAAVFFAHGNGVYTALGVRPKDVKKLPDRVGNRDYVFAQTAEGRLALSLDSSNEIRPLVWPKDIIPPTGEQPEIFADLRGKVGIVGKSEKLKLVTTLPDRIEAITHFPESQKLAVLYTPRGADLTTLEIHPLDDSHKKQTFQLADKDSWSHICWLDHDRLLLSFQGRVSCDYAVYNIATSSYEVSRQTRVMGSFELRGDTLWCVYSTKPKGDADREEPVWPGSTEKPAKGQK